MLFSIRSYQDHVSLTVYSLCAEAPLSTYVREQDLRLIAKILNKDYRDLAAAKTAIPHIHAPNMTSNPYVDTDPKCRDLKDWNAPCFCQWEICIGWYGVY